MAKYIIKTTYNDIDNYYYCDKELDYVISDINNAQVFTLKELIELELTKHFAYTRMEILERER